METNRGRAWMVVGAMVCIVAPTWSVAQSGGSLKVFSPGETVIAADVNNNFSLLQAGSVPTGMVAPFDTGSCPVGWSVYSAGVGRMIVGAGGGRGLGAMGGAETHTLTVAEMPSHSHETPRSANSVNDNHLRGEGDNQRAGPRTSPAGGGQPHNNMPPYVALTFCRKD